MESKKINQLATNVNPQTSDLTTIGDPITGQLKKITWLQVAHLIGAQAAVTLQQVTDNGNTTTDPITTGGLTLTNLGTGVPQVTNGEFVSTYGYGLANGVATLDSGGKIPASQLPSSVMEYKGTWNASTNTPTLADGTGDNGDVYLVNVAGSQNLGSGTISFAVGDWVVYNGTIWQKSLNSNAVASVFGRTGTIVAQEGDYNIDQLGDVAITSAATNDYLRYNGSSWVNTQFPTFVSSDKLVLQVRNNSGATINKGTVVYINGATAGYPTIAKAQANADNTSAQTLGLVQDNISNNSNGIVVLVGQITGIDTSAYPAGTQLYLSGTTAGAFTSTKTLAPTHLVYVGIVTAQNAVNGVIEVKIQNGYELDEIHDVAISSVANNDGLFYESSTSLWKNKSIATVLGYTPEQPLTFSAPLSRSTNTVSIPAATTSVDGYLTATDWTTFNNKMANPMTTLGDIIFGGTSGNPNRLAGNTTSTKQYLSQTGTGTDSASPVWATIAGSDITGAALTKSDDTNVTLTLGGSPSTALLRAASLTLGWTGQLAISRGGTGASTKAGAFDALSPMTTLGDIIYGGASGTGTRLAGSTSASKRFLTQTGDGTISAAPAWGALASADIPNNAADTTGNAATATKLATARTLTIGVTGKTFDGSANVSWSLAEIGAEPTLTKGNLTETTSSVLTITGGTGAVIGSGTTIAVASAGAAQNGVVTTGTQTLAGAKTLTDLLTGTRVAMTASVTSGAANSFAVTQTQRNGTDTGDIAMSVSHTITASSASNQLVIRAMSFGTNNNLTGGGAVTNYRGWNVASSTQTGTTTTDLDQIYIEKGTSDGTVTNNRAIRINNMQGTNQAGFVANAFSGTNNSYILLGTATIPSGKWGIYQSEDFHNNYFAGKLLLATTTDAGYRLDVNGTARLSGALSGTSATFSSSINIRNTSTNSYLQLGTYGSAGNYFDNSTLPNTPSGYMITLAPPSTTNYYGGGIGWSEGTNTAAGINAYDDGAGGALGLSFATGTNTSLVERLKISSTGAATFSGELSVTSGLISISGAGATPPTSGVGLRFVSNRLLIYGGSSDITFQKNDNSGPNLTILESGAATFSSSVTATQLNATTTVAGYAAILTNTNGASDSNGLLVKAGSTSTEYNVRFANQTDTATFFTIKGNGNVGIGTASPSYPLTIDNLFTNAGTLSSGGNLNGTAYFGYGGLTVGTQSTTGHTALFTNSSGRDILFGGWNGSTNTERMRITSGGELLINTTTDSGDYKLQVSGNSYVSGSMSVGTNTLYANNVFLIRGTGTTSGGYALSIQDSNGADIADFRNDKVCRFYSEVYTGGSTDNGAYNLQCNGTGVWGAGAYVNGSDIRLKENIKPILTGLEYVSKMNPVSFNYIKSYSKDQNIQTGFIAQDLKELFKNEEWVNGIVCEGKEFYNVAYQNIIPILTKAIQELKFELDTLKNK